MGGVSVMGVEVVEGDFVGEFLEGGGEFGVFENVFGNWSVVSGNGFLGLEICNDGGVVGNLSVAEGMGVGGASVVYLCEGKGPRPEGGEGSVDGVGFLFGRVVSGGVWLL